jgi:K+-sensing histidine kinase KdpD
MASVAASESERRHAALAWTTAVLGPLAVSGVLVGFRGDLFSTNAAIVLVLPVLAAAIWGGRYGGVVSAVIAALCFDFFFTHPYYSLTISNHDDVETTIVLLVVGLVVGELVVRARRSQQLATASRREVEQVRRIAELAAGRGPNGRLISIVEHEVVELLGARSARFERPPFPTTLPRLSSGPQGRSDGMAGGVSLDRRGDDRPTPGTARASRRCAVIGSSSRPSISVCTIA